MIITINSAELVIGFGKLGNLVVSASSVSNLLFTMKDEEAGRFVRQALVTQPSTFNL